MFNEKTRQIEALQQRVDDCDERHGPWIALAQEVSERALDAEHAVTVDFATRVGQVVDEMVEEERKRLVLEQLDKLPTEIGWQILSNLFDDEKLRAMLAERRAALRDMNERKQSVLLLAIEARETKRLDMASIPANSEAVLELYEEPVQRRPGWKGYDKVTPDRLVRAVSHGDGTFHVISDTSPEWEDDDDKSLKPNIDGVVDIRFGTAYKDGRLLTTLYQNTAVKCEYKDKLKELYIDDDYGSDYEVHPVLGNVEVDGVSMFWAPHPDSPAAARERLQL